MDIINLNLGIHKWILNFVVYGKKYGEPLTLTVDIIQNPVFDKIRKEYGLSTDDNSDEKIFELL